MEKRDEKQGYADRLSGYYDKWYLHTRPDDGEAYDRGCQLAVVSGNCSGHLVEGCSNGPDVFPRMLWPTRRGFPKMLWPKR